MPPGGRRLAEIRVVDEVPGRVGEAHGASADPDGDGEAGDPDQCLDRDSDREAGVVGVEALLDETVPRRGAPAIAAWRPSAERTVTAEAQRSTPQDFRRHRFWSPEEMEKVPAHQPLRSSSTVRLSCRGPLNEPPSWYQHAGSISWLVSRVQHAQPRRRWETQPGRRARSKAREQDLIQRARTQDVRHCGTVASAGQPFLPRDHERLEPCAAPGLHLQDRYHLLCRQTGVV